MIIKQIHADNIFRYAKLQLTNLPTRGLIAISGPNESGKTTMAEVICLALFGRTASLDPQEVTKCIKWGEFRGAVTLEFVGRDEHDYTVIREFDREGNHTAQLRRSNEQTFLARGVEAVGQAIVQIGGFNYARFVDSFYLSQRDMAAPHSFQSSVKILSGVGTLEQVSAELDHDIRTAQESILPLESQIAEVRKQLADLKIEPDLLSRLNTQRQSQLELIAQNEVEVTKRQATASTLQSVMPRLAESVAQVVETSPQVTLEEWQKRAKQVAESLGDVQEACRAVETGADPTQELRAWTEDLENRLRAYGHVEQQADSYRAHLAWLLGESQSPSEAPPDSRRPFPERRSNLTAQIQALAGHRSRVGMWFALTLTATVVLWGISGVLTFAAGSELATWLTDIVGPWNSIRSTLLIAGSGIGIVCFVFFLRILSLAARVLNIRQDVMRVDHETAGVRHEAQTLDQLTSLPLPDKVEALRQIQNGPLSRAAAEFASGPGAPLLESEPLSAYLTQPQTALSTCEKEVGVLRDRLDSRVRAGRVKIEGEQQEVRRFDDALAQEQARHREADERNRQLRAFEAQVADRRRQTEIRRVAKNLVESAHHRLYTHFNLEMQHVAGKIMPLLTQGRYQSLQVDDELQIHVLSNEKENFVDLNEVSGGTYQQVMLAVRLALSQALVASSVGGPEFIILDEPFAFFDEYRTRETLEVLPKLSENLSQAWIISQRFDYDPGFALHLQCSSDRDVLIASGA